MSELPLGPFFLSQLIGSYPVTTQPNPTQRMMDNRRQQAIAELVPALFFLDAVRGDYAKVDDSIRDVFVRLGFSQAEIEAEWQNVRKAATGPLFTMHHEMMNQSIGDALVVSVTT